MYMQCACDGTTLITDAMDTLERMRGTAVAAPLDAALAASARAADWEGCGTPAVTEGKPVPALSAAAAAAAAGAPP